MKSAGRNTESCAWTGHYATFFGQLLENVREGYFADPLYGSNLGMAFWKWIGFPGARADFAD